MTETIQLRELSSKLEYLKSVIDAVEDKNKLDKNTIYEVVYSHMMLKDYVNSGIEDEVVLSEATALLNSFETLVESIPDYLAKSKLEETKIKNIRAVDKIKYKAKTAGFDGTYTKKAYECGQNPILAYIKARGFSWLIIITLAAFLITELPTTIANMMMNTMASISSESSTVSSETSEPSETSNSLSKLQTEDLQASANKTAASLINIFTKLIRVIFYILVMTLIIGISVDMMYIAFPYTRRILVEHIKFVSQDAIQSCELQPDGQHVSYIKVREPDRIKRNLALLDIMKEEYPNSSKLKKLSEKVNNKKYMSSKEYYYTIAQIEFIYDKLLIRDTVMIDSLNIKTIEGWT